MNIKIQKESDILDEGFRARVIEEIEGIENRRRRTEQFKRYEVLKDLTDRYTRNLLLAQLDSQTVAEMEYALTNISFARKIVDKKARVYSNGVKRTLSRKRDTENLEFCARLLDFNSKMKKLNRYLVSMKNVLAYPRPVRVPQDDDSNLFDINLQIIPPYLYDIIENPNMPEEAMIAVLSNFDPDEAMPSASLSPETEGRVRNTGNRLRPRRGDNKDQTIADHPVDEDQPNNKQYQWWSKNWHFTTDAKGAIIDKDTNMPLNIEDPEMITNPIQEFPFVNFAAEQDGAFWALGGSDLTDGGIRINSVLTHIIHIAVTQGYGQLVLKGKNLPRSVKVGPNHAIRLEAPEGEQGQNPDAQFISANPPVDQLLELLKSYVALLLTTNNLSTAGVSANLDGSMNAASGISLIIDKSENLDDIQEDQQTFRDKEKEVWKLFFKWVDVLRKDNLLIEKWDECKVVSDNDLDKMTLTFPQPRVITTESERLENIRKRKELGLNTKLELMMIDDQSLDEKTAREKLERIMEEKQQNMDRMGKMLQSNMNEDSEDDGTEGTEGNGSERE